MSTYQCLMIVDSPADQEVTTAKNTNLKYVRVRFFKVGDPSGNMTLKLLNAAKTSTLATSTALPCDFASHGEYSGTDALTNMSWIRFTFDGTAMRTGTTYNFRLECDSTYQSGVKEEEILSWTQDGSYWKATPTNAPSSVYKNSTLMTAVGSKPAIDSNTKYYWDSTDIWINFDPDVAFDTIVSYPSGINYICAIIDYPKPSNNSDGDPTGIETTNGRNFSRYPRLLLQVFGRDFGED